MIIWYQNGVNEMFSWSFWMLTAWCHIARDVEKWFDTSNYGERRRKGPLHTGRKQKVINVMKNDRGGKIITKFETTAPKTHGNRIQEDDHKIEESKFVNANISNIQWLMRSWYKKYTYRKRTKHFRIIYHENYTATSNKTAMCNPKILDEDGIITYTHRSNIPFVKYFDDKDIPNSVEELKKTYKYFIENDKLWVMMLQEKT